MLLHPANGYPTLADILFHICWHTIIFPSICCSILLMAALFLQILSFTSADTL
jgi:hypothetical protein